MDEATQGFLQVSTWLPTGIKRLTNGSKVLRRSVASVRGSIFLAGTVSIRFFRLFRANRPAQDSRKRNARTEGTVFTRDWEI